MCVLLALCQAHAQSGKSQNPIFNASAYPGADIGAQIAAADTAVGSGCGTILVSAAGSVTTSFTLSPCHSLRLNANLTWTATGTLQGNQSILCQPGTRIDFTPPENNSSVFTTPVTGASTIEAGSACTVSAVAKFPNQYFLFVPASASHITVRNVTLINLIGLAGCGSSAGKATDCADLNLFDSTLNGAVYGLLVHFTHGSKAQRNHFTGTANGAQYWGGDARTDYATIGRMTDVDFSDNVCSGVVACTWGSMGVKVLLHGNIAHGCSDVCFDVEGSNDTVISNNQADGCGNGCGSTFFNVHNALFTGNTFTSKGGGALFLIKNASRNPNTVAGLVMRGNHLSCTTSICSGLLYEASAFDFSDNILTNAVITPTFYNGNTMISNNHLHFDRALSPGGIAINLAPIEFGQTGTISGNFIVSDAAQPAGSMCINAAWSDYNNSDHYVIEGNHCEGTSPFPIDLTTTTNGGNPGPHAFWSIAGNWWGSNRVVHHAGAGNEIYKELDKHTRDGGTWTYTPTAP